MGNRAIRGTAASGKVRFFAAVTTDLVEKARVIHNCTPVASAALGRMLTAASMMGIMLKNDGDKLTVQINGGGKAGAIVTTATSRGIVRGYIENPNVELPLNNKGKLDVGGAVGKAGKLVVIKDMGLKDPYVGQVAIVSGEIAEDITYYFAASEQIPSAVGLGVMVDTNGSVISSGGFIIQMMPDADDYIRDIIEYRLKEIPPVTTIVMDSNSAEAILSELLDGMDMEVMEEYEPDFVCECSREKVERMLISLGRDELKQLADSDEPTEVVCQFCNSKFRFTREDINGILAGLDDIK